APGGRAASDQAIRIGAAIAVAGAAFAFLHLLLLTGTDDRRNPIARRTFTGWRFAIHGLVVLFAITACLVTLVQDKSTWRDAKGYLAILLVWFPSWLVHIVLLETRAFGRVPTRPIREEI